MNAATKAGTVLWLVAMVTLYVAGGVIYAWGHGGAFSAWWGLEYYLELTRR